MRACVCACVCACVYARNYGCVCVYVRFACTCACVLIIVVINISEQNNNWGNTISHMATVMYNCSIAKENMSTAYDVLLYHKVWW